MGGISALPCVAHGERCIPRSAPRKSKVAFCPRAISAQTIRLIEMSMQSKTLEEAVED
jgi:hypothetical protein